MALEECCIGRGVAAIRHKSGSRSYTYYAVGSLSAHFQNFDGEGTVFGSINRQDFSNITFIVPPPQIISVYEDLAYPIDQAIEVNEQQTQTLADLRDALLPRLISGEIRVGEAAALVDEVL